MGARGTIPLAKALTSLGIPVAAAFHTVLGYSSESTSAAEAGGRRARIQPEQRGLPQAAAPDRGPGARLAADGRGRQVLHRHPDPGLGRDEGTAVRGPGPAG